MSITRSLGWIIFFLLLFGGIGYFWVTITTTPTRNTPLSLTKTIIKPIKKPPLSIFPSLSGSASANIVVNKPIFHQKVGNAFVVAGEAHVFENVVSIQVKNPQTNKTIIDNTTTAEAPDMEQFGAFAYTIHLPPTSGLTNGDKVNIQVFQTSAKDGKPLDMVSLE